MWARIRTIHGIRDFITNYTNTNPTNSISTDLKKLDLGGAKCTKHGQLMQPDGPHKLAEIF